MPKENIKDTNRELKKELFFLVEPLAFHEYDTEQLYKKLDQLEALIEKLVTEAKIEELEQLSLEVIEPCEPECDEVRHALHQGSWNAHLKIEGYIATLKGKEN